MKEDVLQGKTLSSYVEMLKKRVFAKDLELTKNPLLKFNNERLCLYSRSFRADEYRDRASGLQSQLNALLSMQASDLFVKVTALELVEIAFCFRLNKLTQTDGAWEKQTNVIV